MPFPTIAVQRSKNSLPPSSRVGSSRGLRSSASLALLGPGHASVASSASTRPSSLSPSSSTFSSTFSSPFSSPSTRSGTRSELRVFSDRMAMSFTACTLPELSRASLQPFTESDYQGKPGSPCAAAPQPEVPSLAEDREEEEDDEDEEEHGSKGTLQGTLQRADRQQSKAARKTLRRKRTAASLRRKGTKARGKFRERKRNPRDSALRIQHAYLRFRQLPPDETARQLEGAFSENITARRKVALALRQSLPLSELDFQHCLLGSEAAARLGAALCRNGTLRVLELRGCYIGCHGAARLASCLRWSPVLRKLGLAWNGISDEGAGELAAQLPKIGLMRYFDLAYNRVGDAGAKSLAVTMKTVPTLKVLALQANRITRVGAAVLLAARREWSELKLEGNNVKLVFSQTLPVWPLAL